jgi:hypothetical protein
MWISRSCVIDGSSDWSPKWNPGVEAILVMRGFELGRLGSLEWGFATEARTIWMRLCSWNVSNPALYLDVGARQAQGKSRFALHLSQHPAPGRVWSLSELVTCYVAPMAQYMGIWWRATVRWLTSHWSEAAGLECFHQMMHVGWAIPIPSGGPIRHGLVGKRF